MSKLSDEQLKDRFTEVFTGELTEKSRWWWLSFCDPNKPEGTQFLGVAILKAQGIATAMTLANIKGINPGGEIKAWALPEDLEPQEKDQYRLLNKDEAEGLVFRKVEV